MEHVGTLLNSRHTHLLCARPCAHFGGTEVGPSLFLRGSRLVGKESRNHCLGLASSIPLPSEPLHGRTQ